MTRRSGVLPLLVVLVLAVAGCSTGSTGTSSPPVSGGAPAEPASSAAAGGELQVYAAASLKAALTRVKEAYEATNAGTTLTISTDSSAALETKIEQGAPADVFLSADATNPQKLVDEGLASGTGITPFAGNRLTVIVPSDNPAGIASPADLARPGVKVIAAGDQVPISTYAGRLVANLAKEPGYPADFAQAYASNVVSKEDNVAAVVSKVELGEGDAAIVYVTDARSAAKVKTLDVPAEANVPVTYGGVVVKASRNQAAAARFLDWLAGPDGQAILASVGFLPAA